MSNPAIRRSYRRRAWPAAQGLGDCSADSSADPNIVDPSFNQLQQNRRYYQFRDPLTVDRYQIGNENRDTVIAVRELNLDGLDAERRSWVNDHTVYTHGFGVAAAYGGTITSRGDPAFWEAGIPSSGSSSAIQAASVLRPAVAVVLHRGRRRLGSVGAGLPGHYGPNGQVMNTYTERRSSVGSVLNV